jgi:hypothetical protein
VAALQRVIYVENNVGVRFVRAFNEFSLNHNWGAVFQHWIHPGMQRAQRGDEWWLEEIGNLGYALLTCDLEILNIATEREAVRRSAIRHVGFADGQYDGWTQMRAITRHWEALDAELQNPGPIAIKVYAGSTPLDIEYL